MAVNLVCFTGKHPVGTFSMYSPKTSKICVTKNISFFNKSYSKWDEVDKPALVPISYGRTDGEDIMIITNSDTKIIIIM